MEGGGGSSPENTPKKGLDKLVSKAGRLLFWTRRRN